MKILFILLIPFFVRAEPTPSLIEKNNQAAKLLEGEKNIEAYKVLTEGLAEAPFQDELHLNLGLAFEKNGEKEKALSEYLSIAKRTRNPIFRFQALFNAARLQGENKKIDEALSLYQQTLEMLPDSREVKTNIELLLAQNGGGGGGKSDDQKKDKGEDKKDGNKGDPKEDEKEKDKDEPKDGDKDKPDRKYNPKGDGKPKPQPFKSGELNNQDVKNILDELKRQENQVRAKENDKKPKENKSGKDW